MNQVQNKMRSRVIYSVSAFVLAIMSLCLIAKPVLSAIYPLKYEEAIKKYSEMYSIDEHLIMAIISVESKFRENAVSTKGAKGLMQLKDETALWCMENFNIEDSGDKNDLNINLGCAYFRYLTDKYKGYTDTALAAYNAGEGNVSLWLESQGNDSVVLVDIPFGETKKYVEKVNKRFKIYKFLY